MPRLPCLFVLAGLCLVIVCMATDPEAEGENVPRHRSLVGNEPCVKWGNTFDVPLGGKNLERGCQSPSGSKVCCAAMDSSVSDRGIGNGYRDSGAVAKQSVQGEVNLKDVVDLVDRRKLAQIEFLEDLTKTRLKDGGIENARDQERLGGPTNCKLSREYFSSPHEEREIQKAEEIGRIGAGEMPSSTDIDDGSKLPIEVHEKRLDALLNHILSEDSIKNATQWLDRVSKHMSSEKVPEDHGLDREFLSRFEVSKTCGGKVVKRWTEWIEPLTVTTRHPFSYSTCKKIWQRFSSVPRIGRSDVDYVLLKSGKQLYDEEQGEGPVKHYLLDAGTSKFESSLSWFTCAFSQRKVSFDSVFAWEKTLLEPSDYWSRVPPKWMPYWHFFNDAISADETAHNSPVRMLKQMATPRDFIAWKLDIDHPETEMPIATSLLKDGAFAGLIDEFFFELHYRCEVMTSCGWGKRVPASHSGLQLERASVMKYFADLRKAGIRAHVWP